MIKKVRLLGPLSVGLLRKNDFFKLELNCLDSLYKNYPKYSKKYFTNMDYPFPIIYKLNNDQFKLSNNGISLNKLRSKIVVPKYKLQLKNIIHNLKGNNIKHFDMCFTGKNIVVNKKGTISLIDFNLSQINNFPSTLFINIRSKKFKYKKLYDKMEDILKKNKYIILE